MKTVGDIMATDVVTVAPDTTLRELAQILSDSQISGVPVVDSSKTIVGVVSSTDLVRHASEPVTGHAQSWSDVLEDSKPEYVPSFFRVSDTSWLDWTSVAEPSTSWLDETTVREIMTTVPFTVPTETSIHMLAQFLSDRKIHRALVTGPTGLVGIVTTFDVLRACHDLLGPTAQA